MNWSDFEFNFIIGCRANCDNCPSSLFYEKYWTKKDDSFHEVIFNQQNYFEKIPSESKYIDCSNMSDPAFWDDFHFLLLNEKAVCNPNKKFIITTKFPRKLIGRKFNSNIWVGISCSNQEQFDHRIEALKYIDTSKRIVFFEPLNEIIKPNCDFKYIDWAIIGTDTLTNNDNYNETLSLAQGLDKYNVPTLVKNYRNKRIYTSNQRYHKLLMRYDKRI